MMKIVQIFVCFSESLNFTDMLLILLTYFESPNVVPTTPWPRKNLQTPGLDRVRVSESLLATEILIVSLFLHPWTPLK